MFIDDSARAGEIPMEVSVNGRVVKIGERAFERRDRAPEVLEQRAGAMTYSAERGAGHVRDGPDEVRSPVVASNSRDNVAAERGQRARTRWQMRRDVSHGRLLGFEQFRSLEGVRDLENAALARGGGQEEVLVALARQTKRGRVDTI